MPAPAPEAAELPPHYYRDNFCRLLDTVEAQYGDLLDEAETVFLQRYRSVGFDAQCLYVRLASRVGPWFREARLQYPELGPLQPALDQLLQSGLANEPSALTTQDLGQLCTVAELTALSGQVAADKATLLQAIEQSGISSIEWVSLLESQDDARIVAPCQTGTVALFELLFFGNRRQGMTDFVLSDLGLFRYYPYTLDRSQRLFPDRAALQDYLACAAWEDQWFALLESGEEEGMRELAASLIGCADGAAPAYGRWSRLYNRVARQMERLGEAQLALALYNMSDRHPARERSARLHEKSGDDAGAEALCLAITADPWCEDEADAAGRILPRVQARLHGRRNRRRRDSFEERCLTLPREPQRVERLAARALSAQWETVLYVENDLMNGLFGLAFWEQIFAPVAGAFNNPYQSVPADMYERTFSARRRALLSQRMAMLAKCDLAAELEASWFKHRGFQCRWVNWRTMSHELVRMAASTIPAEHLLAVWQRMLFDPRENRRGFPDLIALGGAKGSYAMIEVKGPGDTLQASQKRWLRFFQQAGIPASIAHVQWIDD